jgi:CPA1 family monovalent cation:H+ antiporter
MVNRRQGELSSEELERDMERDTPFRRFRQRFQGRRTPEPVEPHLCEHLDAAPARDVGTPSTCDDHTDEDGPVVHLRTCLACGYVGCCDSSRGRHATAHFEEEGHPVMQSAEPGEAWRWCYVHELLG